jgi:hypothetical protein
MRSDEVGVMLFGGPYGIMTQQHLNSPNIRPVRQEFNGERVPKSMRVGVDPGQFTNGIDRTPQAADDARQFALSGPKKVRRVSARRGERFERIAGVGVKREFNGRRSLLCLPDEQMPALFDLSAAQAGDIADPQASVKQRQQESASPLLVRAQPIAGEQHLAYFLPAEWQRGNTIDTRRLDGLRGVFGEPAIGDAKRAERAEMPDLFPLGPRSHGAGGAEGPHQLNIETGDGATAGRLSKGFEHVGIGAEGRSLQVPCGAVGEVCLDRSGNRNLFGCRENAGGVGRVAENRLNAAVGDGGLSRMQGPLVNLAGNSPVGVNRATTQAVIAALADVRAGFEVAAVRVEVVFHGSDFDTSFDTAKWAVALTCKLFSLFGLWARNLGRLVGFEPEPPQNRSQVEPTTYRTNRLNGRYRSHFDVCQKVAA